MMTYEMLEKATSAILYDEKEPIGRVMEMEEVVDEINETIEKFLDNPQFEKLNQTEFKKLAYLRHSITDIERVGDHANNLAELADKKLTEALQFSKDAQEELNTMCMKTKLIYEKSLIALADENKDIVKSVWELEDEIDNLQRVFEANHVRRLENKICNPLVGIVFVDILRNLERIADNSTNIANAILLGF